MTGTPYNDGDDQTDDELTYTLAGEGEATTGAVRDRRGDRTDQRGKQGATLDYETDNTHRETETWTRAR